MHSDDLSWALKQALHSFSGSGQRWDDRRQRGLTDEELRAAIGYEFGMEGGFCGPGLPSYNYMGGSNPAFWLGLWGAGSIKPTLSGQRLLDEARAVLEIPVPGSGFQISLF